MSSGYIKLTQACSHHCLTCPCSKSDEDRTELSLDEVRATVEKGLEHGLDSVILSGGEPTLHSRIVDVVRYLVSRPVKIGFLTTGESFADDCFMSALLKEAPAERLRILVAIHSFDEEKHDAITNCPGSLARSLLGMRKAVDVGISVTMKYLVTQTTYRDMPEYIREYDRIFPVNVPLVIDNIDYCGTAFKARERLKVSFAESRPYLEGLLDFAVELAEHGRVRSVQVFDTPLCAVDRRYWKFFRSQVNWKLAVFQAASIKGRECVENLQNTSGPFFEPCYQCAVQRICPGAWLSVKSVLGEDILVPVAGACGECD